MPRKVSTGPDAAESLVCELAMFWKYLDRVYELPEAKSIVEWLSADDLVALLETELSDASNSVLLDHLGGIDRTVESEENE